MHLPVPLIPGPLQVVGTYIRTYIHTYAPNACIFKLASRKIRMNGYM